MSTIALTASSVGTFQQMTEIEQAVRGYLATIRHPNTKHAYTQHLAHFLAWCNLEDVDPLTAVAGQLSMYLTHIMNDSYERGGEWHSYSESAISSRWIALRGFYKYATHNDYVMKNRTLGLEVPKVDHAKQKCTYLPTLAFTQFVTEAQKNGTIMEGALVALLAGRALRITEACNLNIENIASVRGTMMISYISKGNVAMESVLAPEVAWAVSKAIEGREVGPVLLNQQGRRMSRQVATHMIRQIAARAGVDTDISPHSLRRSFITTGVSMGVALYDLQQTVGHKSSTTTARYDRLANGSSRDKSSVVMSFVSGLAT